MAEATHQPKSGKTSTQSTGKKTVKVASIQAPSIFKNTQANITLFTKLIKQAAANGAKFIVLPEAAITGYASQDFKHSWCIPIDTRRKHLDKKKFTAHDPKQYAELKDGEMVKHFQHLCAELKVYLTVPYVEKVECPPKNQNDNANNISKFFPDYPFKYYNTITLVDPSGQIVGHYRKTNLWPYYDYPWATPGKGLVTAETEYGTVGLGICFDIHKILPGYKKLNIWTLLYCIAWVDDEEFKWFDTYLPQVLGSKDIEFNVIGCNWSVQKYKTKESNVEEKQSNDDNETSNEDKIEVEYDWSGYGKTHLYGPKGKIIAFTDNLYDNEIIYANIPYGK
eukprot:319752_1